MHMYITDVYSIIVYNIYILVIGTVYGIENRKNRNPKFLRFCLRFKNRKQKTLRFYLRF